MAYDAFLQGEPSRITKREALASIRKSIADMSALVDEMGDLTYRLIAKKQGRDANTIVVCDACDHIPLKRELNAAAGECLRCLSGTLVERSAPKHQPRYNELEDDDDFQEGKGGGGMGPVRDVAEDWDDDADDEERRDLDEQDRKDDDEDDRKRKAQDDPTDPRGKALQPARGVAQPRRRQSPYNFADSDGQRFPGNSEEDSWRSKGAEQLLSTDQRKRLQRKIKSSSKTRLL